MRLKNYYIYILASAKNGTLYIGVTNDLHKRVFQHKSKEIDGFTKNYGVDRLVYFESHDTAESAITREKNMKAWKREWKVRLIEKDNPGWRDISDDF
jgi:putative endonuclease